MRLTGRFLLVTLCVFSVTACAHGARIAPSPTPPEEVSRVMPQSTSVKGVMIVEFVVLKDGKVGDVRVLRSLDPALDQSVITAIKQWRYKPGTKAGKPVDMKLTRTLNF
jgi:protein TonB